MGASIVTEYIELRERVAVEALFSEEVEARLFERIDQLWHAEMSAADRAEVEARLVAKARAWRCMKNRHEPKDRTEP